MNMRRTFLVALCACMAAPLYAQTPAATSLFTARILDARTEKPIAEASILLPGLERTARSDAKGNLRLAQLPAGKHVALVRAVGYDSLLFAIDIARADTAEADLMLTPIAQTLEKVNVEAKGGMEAVRLAEYESRKKMGFGKFMDSTVFGDGRRLPVVDILGQRLAGIGIERPRGGAAFLASRRGRSRMSTAPCLAQVIIDGINLGAYDLTLIDPDEVLAMEYHTVATVPLKFRSTGGGGGSAACGTLIVWRKMR